MILAFRVLSPSPPLDLSCILRVLLEILLSLAVTTALAAPYFQGPHLLSNASWIPSFLSLEFHASPSSQATGVFIPCILPHVTSLMLSILGWIYSSWAFPGMWLSYNFSLFRSNLDPVHSCLETVFHNVDLLTGCRHPTAGIDFTAVCGMRGVGREATGPSASVLCRR